MDKLVWPVLHFSASLCWLPNTDHSSAQRSKWYLCEIQATFSLKLFFFPLSFSSFPSLPQGQERELLSTSGRTCCLYRALQFSNIQKSRTVSVFLAEDILKYSAKTDFKPLPAFPTLTTTTCYVCSPPLINTLQGSSTGEMGRP